MTDQPSLQSLDSTDTLALEGVRIHSRISGFSQDVTVEQRFRNNTSKPIEAVYTFPLPEDAVVHTLEIHKGDSVLYGEIETNEKAQDLYQDAISDGHSAYLAESHRPDIFSTSVGNLAPGESVAIHIGYLTILKPMDEEVRLSFPATIAPRYVPQSTKGTEANMDADFVNPPHVKHVPYGLEVQVDIDEGFPLVEVDSPTHEILQSQEGGGQRSIRLKGGDTEMNGDVIILLKLERQKDPVALASMGPDGTHYVTMALYPEIDHPREGSEPTETIFILDASGSMQGYGRSYEQAQRALELGLRSLKIGDTFNIIRFGSTFEKWKQAPQAYTEESLMDAVAYINNSSADLGGTELLAPLEDLFQQKIQGSGIRQVLLLTDGQVSNEDAVHQLARKHASQNRIFSFGIGNASSQHLVRGLAEATGGEVEFISDNERIEPIVLRTFSRMASPMIKDLHLEFDGGSLKEYDLGTSDFRPIFDGDAYIIHAQVSGGLPKEAVLKGNGPTGPVQWKVTIRNQSGDSTLNHHKLWASQKIRTLEAGSQSKRYETSFDQRRGNRQEERIVEISKKHGVLSRNTSFVAVEYRSPHDRLSGNPELKRIPVQLPTPSRSIFPIKRLRHAGMAVGAMAGIAREESKPAVNYQPGVLCCHKSPPDRIRYSLAEPYPAIEDGFYKQGYDKEGYDRKGYDNFDGLSDLLKLQHADGGFYPYTSGGKEDLMLDLLKTEGIDPEPNIVDTLHVLKRLHSDFHDSQSQWKRAAQKALDYLTSKLGNQIVTKLLEALQLPKTLVGKTHV